MDVVSHLKPSRSRIRPLTKLENICSFFFFHFLSAVVYMFLEPNTKAWCLHFQVMSISLYLCPHASVAELLSESSDIYIRIHLDKFDFGSYVTTAALLYKPIYLIFL
jgi:hypothetical protein